MSFESWIAEVDCDLRKNPLTGRERWLCMMAWEQSGREQQGADTLPAWRYTLHNLFGHPLMHVLVLLRMKRAAWWLHEKTLPREVRGQTIRLAVEAGEYFGSRR